MKHIITYFVLGMALLGAPLGLFAETNSTTTLTAESAMVEQAVHVAELGVSDVWLLPTSSLYFIKEWKRGFTRLFTFGEVNNTALLLRFTNEKMAEALEVEATNPTNVSAFREALENYQDAENKLGEKLKKVKLKEDDKKAKELFARLDKESVVRATVLSRVEKRWTTDPYAEDATRTAIQGDPDFDMVAKTVRNSQSTIINSWTSVFERRVDVKQRAEAELVRAESEYNLLKTEVIKFLTESGDVSGAIAIREQGVKKPEISIDEAIVMKMAPLHSGIENAKYAPTRIDNTPARISTNMTIGKQTQGRDFGDRMKAGLETAGGMLANGKSAFAEGKFGEAFGHARTVLVMVGSTRREMEDIAIKEQGVKSGNPLYYDKGMVGEHPLRGGSDQKTKVCHPSATETCDNGTELERPTTPQPKTEPTVVPRTALPVACTEEAKMCPDGSSVGRTGPACAFTACPTTTTPTPKPTEAVMCTTQYDPVCGVDGKTYGNACEANVSGVRVSAKGECATAIETGTMKSPDAR